MGMDNGNRIYINVSNWANVPVGSKRSSLVMNKLAELPDVVAAVPAAAVVVGGVAVVGLVEFDMRCTSCFVHLAVAVVAILTAVWSSYLYPLDHYFDCCCWRQIVGVMSKTAANTNTHHSLS